MSSTVLIYASYIVWTFCAAAFVFFLVYDSNRARQVRKWLRKDYGKECCRRLQIAGTDNSSASHVNMQGEEDEET